MRTIKDVHKAVYEPIADLITYRALPNRLLPMNALDPFIFLNHHGRQEYQPHNNGLPFGPHPHRGFETVTFILEGDLTHMDTGGGKSVISEGGVQWMTAGKGLIHAEISSEEFKRKGGPLEILQLWVNLPAKFKMAEPKYIGLQKNEIPQVQWDNGKVTAHLISGSWQGTEAPIKPFTDIHLARIQFAETGTVSFSVPLHKTIFLYVISGSLNINETDAQQHHLVQFKHDGEEIHIRATTDAQILFGFATPFNEPFKAYGPFVMNTEEEIQQAYEDYNKGKFGDPSALMH